MCLDGTAVQQLEPSFLNENGPIKPDRSVLLNELISVLIGVFLLHILRNTRGTVNQGATSE